MFKISFLMLSVILLAFACQDDQLVTQKVQSNLVIKTGTICGWCSMNDTLTIRENIVRYVNYTQCNNSKPSAEKNGQLTNSELQVLLSKFDFNEFKKLDLNSSNVSFDGCDDWIYFDNGSESHYIRFTRNEPKLMTIQVFIDQLYAIKTQYIGNNSSK